MSEPEYVYRVVDKDGNPAPSRGRTNWTRLSTAKAYATGANNPTNFVVYSSSEKRPYRVQRAAVIWEDV